MKKYAALTAREQDLVRRGYSESFIREVNHIHEDTIRKITSEIFQYITRDCVPVSQPKALFIGGQPGSGKSILSRLLRSYAEYENCADVCIDNYRTWHPNYTRIEQEISSVWEHKTPIDNDTPGNDIADFTHAFAGRISDLLIDALSTPKQGRYYSICIDWGLRSPDQPLDCMKKLAQQGYENEVIYLCVPSAVSHAGCRYRADCMNSGEHIYRRIPDYFHTLCIASLPESCSKIYTEGVIRHSWIHTFSLRSRANEILWETPSEAFPEPGLLYSQILRTIPEALPVCDIEETMKTFYTESLGLLKQELWFSYLLRTEQQSYNVERVRLVERSHKNYTLNYVENTLRYVRYILPTFPKAYQDVLVRSLQWAETAKAGSASDRERWRLMGLDLSIHNEASAELYLLEGCSASADSDWTRKVTYALIKTHGLWGQILRGETEYRTLQPVLDLILDGSVDPDLFAKILYSQNRAVIKAASDPIWQSVKPSIIRMISVLCFEKRLPEETDLSERVRLLFPHACPADQVLSEEEISIYREVLTSRSLWYPQISLDTFSCEEILTVFKLIRAQLRPEIRNISFEPFMKTMFYDYEGMRRINIYKKRMVEACLKDAAAGITGIHVRPFCEIKGTTLYFDVKFTSVSEKLVDFCVEAERSGLIEYQKNIVNIFDLFGLRRDIFDRLNNEEKYLETMNDTAASRKNEIIDHITGTSAADVGSGGGVLLDLLEQKYPSLKIIGTDISENVIETLQDKIQKEGHAYSVLRHNFVEDVLPYKVDNILFSSILHEIYSYTEVNGLRFQISSVENALRHAAASLNPGGRIIIRDGVLSEETENGQIRLKTAEGISFARNYLRDFKGLLHLRDTDGNWKPEAASLSADGTLTGNINLIREFLYTYTWGIESYSCEVNEQFGYYHLSEFTAFLESCGLKILHAETYLESGYPDHLNQLVDLVPPLAWEAMPSSLFIVAEKEK